MQSNRCQSLQSQVSTNSANLIIKKISTFVTDPHSVAQNQLSGSKLWEVRAFNNWPAHPPTKKGLLKPVELLFKRDCTNIHKINKQSLVTQNHILDGYKSQDQMMRDLLKSYPGIGTLSTMLSGMCSSSHGAISPWLSRAWTLATTALKSFSVARARGSRVFITQLHLVW